MRQDLSSGEPPSPAALSLFSGLLRDAVALAASGVASPEDIDLAMQLGAGHPVGPLTLLRELDPAVRAGAGLPEPPAVTGVSDGSPQDADNEPWARPVGVAGTGTMASGIVEALVRAGVPTVVLGRSQASADRLRAAVATSMDAAVAKGRLTGRLRDGALNHLSLTTDPGALADCGHVIEAVAEDLAVKRELLALLDRSLPERTILATNTSSLTVAEIRAGLPARRTVLALHFFNPAKAMKLVEVAGADEGVLDAACGWIRRIGKVPVRCGDERGFVVNRLLIPYLNDAVRALGSGAFTAAEADALMREALGHPMGPFELIDLIGTDVTAAAQTMLHAASGDARLKPADGLLALVDGGRLGRKSGAGFHDHSAARSGA
ncbi:3-hydroxyacyl-CoA dehydrogenase family protein [Streptomyces sp. NRRL S-646]|uniref:3-hydroxyacyl-CoA dehydrogenase family protein n=1 Tax=Streptomyces sp. NRRL S-646 TaxID=1463917 RepID=UPI00068DB39F|nr:3-hydroxyacyl-CoA dehydrogenase family protein [Streptomyces sp. NRRL S-646]